MYQTLRVGTLGIITRWNNSKIRKMNGTEKCGVRANYSLQTGNLVRTQTQSTTVVQLRHPLSNACVRRAPNSSCNIYMVRLPPEIHKHPYTLYRPPLASAHNLYCKESTAGPCPYRESLTHHKLRLTFPFAIRPATSTGTRAAAGATRRARRTGAAAVAGSRSGSRPRSRRHVSPFIPPDPYRQRRTTLQSAILKIRAAKMLSGSPS